ncbi:hypothetical protein ACLMJK_004845 [Lecanora helva]
MSANMDSQKDTKPVVPKDLEGALTLLKKHDDTSRFVGLALLKPILESELKDGNASTENERDALVQRCWNAVPGSFLDRLLKARAIEKQSKDEAGNMVALAVAIVHAFVSLLPHPETDEKVVDRIQLLKATLRSCNQTVRDQIIAIFHNLALTPRGIAAIFTLEATKIGSDQKPDTYLLVTILLIDIRSTIPSLQELLHSAKYPAISDRLVKAYDLVSAFIGFLVQSLDQMTFDQDPLLAPVSAPLPVDLLLKLRTNISETISLTIEHLRDRYDSSIAGAAGLHPSARNPSNGSSSSPLPLAWDSSSGMFEDLLTLSQLRTLSLWLRDEENDALRNEASGLMDVLFALYQHNGDQDFRSPVLVALEGIVQTPTGIDAFIHEGAWNVLFTDLSNILSQSSRQPIGIEIVRILLTVAESDDTGPPKNDWTSPVSLAQKHLTSTTPVSALELPIAISQLAVELLTRAPRGLRGEYRTPTEEILRSAQSLMKKRDVKAEDREGLEEVVEGLASLDL